MLSILALAGTLTIAVVDGDTVDIDGERIRIATIDAPEIGGAKCDAERLLGRAAKRRLEQLLGAGPIEILRGDPADGRLVDRHGRTLAVIRAGGRDVGAILVDEDLARPWAGRRAPWCDRPMRP